MATNDLTITTAGIYSGTYGTVTVAAPSGAIVTLNDMIADRVVQDVPVQLTITNCSFGGAGADPGILIWRFAGPLTISNNLLIGTGGMMVRDFSGLGKSVSICRNHGINISGATSATARNKTSFIQLQRLTLSNIEIAWNWLQNTKGVSACEDAISLMISGGTAASPALVHDNLVDGNYNYPANQPDFSGSGIMAYDPGGSTGVGNVGHSKIYSNVVLGTEHQSYACAGGNNIEIYSNRAVNDGVGSYSTAYQVWNWQDKTPVADFTGIACHGNYSGYAKKETNRIDYALAPVVVQNNNTAGIATEAVERTQWHARCASASVVVGPQNAAQIAAQGAQ